MGIIISELTDQITFYSCLSNSPNTSLSSEDCCVSLAAFGLSLAASSTLISAFCKKQTYIYSDYVFFYSYQPETFFKLLNYVHVTFLTNTEALTQRVLVSLLYRWGFAKYRGQIQLHFFLMFLYDWRTYNGGLEKASKEKRDLKNHDGLLSFHLSSSYLIFYWDIPLLT